MTGFESSLDKVEEKGSGCSYKQEGKALLLF